jgi:hypothetical protein
MYIDLRTRFVIFWFFIIGNIINAQDSMLKFTIIDDFGNEQIILTQDNIEKIYVWNNWNNDIYILISENKINHLNNILNTNTGKYLQIYIQEKLYSKMYILGEFNIDSIFRLSGLSLVELENIGLPFVIEENINILSERIILNKESKDNDRIFNSNFEYILCCFLNSLINNDDKYKNLLYRLHEEIKIKNFLQDGLIKEVIVEKIYNPFNDTVWVEIKIKYNLNNIEFEENDFISMILKDGEWKINQLPMFLLIPEAL